MAKKIQKLVSLDALASVWEHASRAAHPVDARRILATIDRDEIARISQLNPRRAGARRVNAWDDVGRWIDINVKRAQNLWLDRAPRLRLLDLGCGAGYFLHVCRFFGHRGIGLDTGDDPFFGALISHFGIQRTVSRIEPNVPLPDLGEKFDLVTAYRICFQRTTREPDGTWNEWAPSNWKFFINDVRAQVLKPGGRLLLDFNPRQDGSSFFTPELRKLFLAEGARIFRSSALFATDPQDRPRFRQLQKATNRSTDQLVA